MKILKYIIDDNDNPVLFSREKLHRDVSGSAKSAGFLTISYNSASNRLVAKCFGRSTSLNVAANEVEDGKIIEELINN